MPQRKYLKGTERLAVAVDLKRLYDAGASIREIAETTGRKSSTVRDLLQFAGTHMRPGVRDPGR